jgi:hypothetical protein
MQPARRTATVLMHLSKHDTHMYRRAHWVVIKAKQTVSVCLQIFPMIPSDDDASAELSECAQGKLAVKPKKGSGETCC